jgi:DNA-binding protein H-NS
MYDAHVLQYGARMATAKKVPRSDLLTQIESLAKQKKQLESELHKSQAIELKRLVAAFKKSLKDSRIELEDALKLFGVGKKPRAKRGSKTKAPKLYKTGVTYKKPRGDETWVGGTKGRQPAWLKELIASGRTYESLAAKK